MHPPRLLALSFFLCALAPWGDLQASQRQLPPPIDVAQPSPAPELPSEFDRFDPPVGGPAPGADAPDISEWTRTGGPGEALVLGGSAHGETPRYAVFGQTTEENGTFTEVDVLTSSTSGSVVALSPDLPDWGMYYIWPAGPQGVGTPVAVNRAEGWWVYPQRAIRGEPASVFGRNLSFQNGREKAWVFLQPEGDTGVWAEVIAVNPYKIDFIVPEDLPKGPCQVWVHNGHGGDFGWHSPSIDNAGPFTADHLKVEDAIVWDGGIFNVKEFGAAGDGETDDSPAIKRALDAASAQERATLFFPEGTYMISETIAPISGPEGSAMRVMGAGREVSVIKCLSGFGSNNMITLAGKDMEVRDLAFRLNSAVDGKIPKGKKAVINTGSEWLSGMKLVDCIFDGERSLAFRLARYRDVLIQGCTVIANENQVGTLNSMLVDNCKFYGRADAGMALYSLGGYNIAVTNCTAEDFDRSGPDVHDQFQGRFVTGSAYGQRVDNWYIGQNTTIDLTVRPSYFNQNTGEQIMWEFMEAHDQAPVASATKNDVTFTRSVTGKRIPWFTNAIVISGKGIGQSRPIRRYDNETFTAELSRPWRIVPDATSVIVIAENIQRVVVYDNDLSGKERAYQHAEHIASSGVQPFGASHTMIVDGNRMKRLRSGIATFGLTHNKRGVSPTFFNVYANNSFEKMHNAIRHSAGVDQTGQSEGLSTFGNIARGNHLREMTRMGVIWSVAGNPGRLMSDLNVFEGNTIEDTPLAFRIWRAKQPDTTRNTVLYRNDLQRGDASATGSIGVEGGPNAVISVDNVINGFEKPGVVRED